MKYLTKTELNELLYVIEQDNKLYGLILKLMYLYGKDFKQIISLRKEDITSNSIKFKDKAYPLQRELLLDICEYSEDKEYIFLKEQDNIAEEIHNYRKRVIYYLNNNLKQLELPSNIKYSGVSLTDIRRLRGQHLILNGVDLKIVMELYQQQPNARTQFKKYLHYDDLYKISQSKDYYDIDDVFNYCTDLDVFQIDEFNNNNQYIVTNMEESTLILLDYDNVTFIEKVTDEFKNKVLDIYQNFNLNGVLNGLQPNQYKLLNDLKFIKV